jgi:hypothetical protein
MTRGGTSSAPAFGFASGGPASTRHVGGERPSEQPRRTRPVESWTATEADVLAWLDSARQGDRFIYAHGPSLIQGAAAALVGRLKDTGEIVPHNKRSEDGGFDFIVIRNRVRTVTARPPVCDPHMMAVLLVAQEAAAAGERCPSDAEIGARTALSADQVKWQLKKLEAGRFIARRFVPTAAEPKFRVVKVIATGAETAGPDGGAK